MGRGEIPGAVFADKGFQSLHFPKDEIRFEVEMIDGAVVSDIWFVNKALIIEYDGIQHQHLDFNNQGKSSRPFDLITDDILRKSKDKNGRNLEVFRVTAQTPFDELMSKIRSR